MDTRNVAVTPEPVACEDTAPCSDGDPCTVDDTCCGSDCCPGTQIACGANVLANPGFEEGTASWTHHNPAYASFETRGAPWSVGSGEAAAYITVTADEYGGGRFLQLYQIDFPVVEDTLYAFAFSARSEPPRPFVVRLIRHVSPFESYGLVETVQLQEEWQRFELRFRVATDSPPLENPRMQLMCDAAMQPLDLGDFYAIDDVVLAPISE